MTVSGVGSAAFFTIRKSSGLGFGEGLAGFGLENPDQGAGLHVGFIFSSLAGRQFAIVALFGQFFHARLHAFADTEFRQGARRFDAEAAADWLQHLLEHRAALSMIVSHDDNINTLTRKATYCRGTIEGLVGRSENVYSRPVVNIE